jgi:hypothetical protein
MNRRAVAPDVRAPVVAIFVCFLAGCLSTGSPPSATRDVHPTVDASLLTSPAKLLGPGADAESSLAVSPDGKTILACSHGGFTQVSPLWASTDSGASFKRIEPQPNQPFNGDCDVAIADDGSWYITYDTAASATVAATPDQGATWRINYVDAMPYGGVDRPWIQAAGGKTVYLSYQNVAPQGSIDTLAVSTDAGLTWVPHVVSRAEPPQWVNSVAGHPFLADGGRTIYVLIARAGQGNGGPRQLDLAISRDAGTTWATQRITNPAAIGGLPTATRAADGTLYLAYTRPSATRGIGDIVVSFSKDDAKTWVGPGVVAANESVAGFPTTWIDGRPDGSATLAWMTSRKMEDGTTVWQLSVARVSSGAGLKVEFQGRVGPAGAPTTLYEFPMVRHDQTGRAYVAFPLVTGPSCKQTPLFPSAVGSGQVPRNNQCQYLLREDGARAS